MPRRWTWRLGIAATALLIVISACDPPGVARAAKPELDAPPREVPYPRDMAVVDVADDGCSLGSLPSGGASWTPDLGLVGDESFEAQDLPPEVRCWYEVVWQVVQDPARARYFTGKAAQNDLYFYARTLNTHLTGLMTAFRLTGDLALLDEVDRLTQTMRAQLDDRWTRRHSTAPGSVDGYLNWVWDQSSDNSHRGRDVHEVDEMRTHSVLAQVAYAFESNSGLKSPNGVDYEERATFWVSYLRDHFEAKWRDRNGAPWPEFPFMERPHVHETIEFVRYHHYMHLLTGEEPYRREARRLSEAVYENFEPVETQAGTALVTPRSVLSMGGSQDYLLPSTYFRYVVATAVDLNLEGVGPWDEADVMAGLATSVSEFILDEESGGYGRDVGGGVARAGIQPTPADSWSRMSTGTYNQSAFAWLAPWDPSGEVAETSLAVHLHRGQREWMVYIPVGLLLDAVLSAEARVSAD